MKIITKLSVILLIGLFSISNIYAEGFPDEPMIIYGNIDGINNKTLKIYDGNRSLLKQVNVSNSKYGTNKTFDTTNKIILNKFDGNLIFKIDGYNSLGVSKGNTNMCKSKAIFQKGQICEYNINFAIQSSSGSSSRRDSSSSHRSSNSSSNRNSNPTNVTNKKPLVAPIQGKNIIKKSGIQRNKEGKIVIKSKDYIKNIRRFNVFKKKEAKVFGYKVLNLKGNDSYNKGIQRYTKKVYNEIKIDGIRRGVLSSLDKVTKTYGILSDESLSPELRDLYTAKLKEDKEYLELKFKKLKRKDLIVRYNLAKRKLRK